MIETLKSPKFKTKSKRVGRGMGSGKGGHTTGRGMKGQRSRSGYKKPGRNFEGGQNPLSKRLPTLRGLSTKARTRKFKTSKILNIALQTSDLAEAYKKGETVSLETLKEKGIVKERAHKKLNLKIVLDSEPKTTFNVDGIKVSASAAKAIEKAGGKIS